MTFIESKQPSQMIFPRQAAQALVWPAAVASLLLSLSGLAASIIAPIRPRPAEPPVEVLRDAFNGENSGPAHVYCVAFSPTGSYFLAGGDAGGRSPVRIYDGSSGKLVSKFLPAENLGWSGGRFSPDGAKVVSWGSSSATLYVWESATGRQLLKLEGHQQPASFAAFSPDQKRIVSGSADGTLRVWDASTGKELLVLKGHTDVCGGFFSPDGKHIVSFSNDKTVRGWDATTGKEVWKHTDSLFYVNNNSFSSDGRVLSLGSDGSVRVFEIATGKVVANLKGPADAQGAAFVRNGQQLVWWAKDKTLRVWDMAGRKVVRVVELGGDLLSEPDNVTVSPHGSLLVTGHTDQTVRVRDLATGKELHRFVTAPRTGTGCGRPRRASRLAPPLQHLFEVWAVAISADGKTALTGSDDKTARLWDTATGKPLGPPLQHRNGVRAVAISADGKTALTGSDDKTARLWDTATGKPLGPPPATSRVCLEGGHQRGRQDGADRTGDRDRPCLNNRSSGQGRYQCVCHLDFRHGLLAREGDGFGRCRFCAPSGQPHHWVP